MPRFKEARFVTAEILLAMAYVWAHIPGERLKANGEAFGAFKSPPLGQRGAPGCLCQLNMKSVAGVPCSRAKRASNLENERLHAFVTFGATYVPDADCRIQNSTEEESISSSFGKASPSKRKVPFLIEYGEANQCHPVSRLDRTISGTLSWR